MKTLKYIKIRDEMGVLGDKIPLTVEAENVEVASYNNQNLETVLLDNKLHKDKVNSELINLKAKDKQLEDMQKSLGSGSPLVAASLSEMTDKTKIYVNLEDGHWYYFSDSWTDGGGNIKQKN